MIFDLMQNIGNYIGLAKNLDTAIEYIMANDFHKMKDGRYEVDAGNVSFTVTPTQARLFKDTKFETHRVYIDIQIPLVGGEIMEVYPANELPNWQPYIPQRDISYLETDFHGIPLPMREGYFCILFPQDAHRGGQYQNGVTKGRKVIFKVRI